MLVFTLGVSGVAITFLRWFYFNDNVENNIPDFFYETVLISFFKMSKSVAVTTTVLLSIVWWTLICIYCFHKKIFWIL